MRSGWFPRFASLTETALPNSARRPSDEPESLDLIQADRGFSVANWGRYNLLVWRAEISALGVSVWTRAFSQLKQAFPGQPLGQLTLIEPECVFGQSPSAFPACVEALRRFSDCLAASAVVYTREGFWNAAMRGRVMAMHGESKTEVPFALRPTLADAYAWMREHAPGLPNVTLGALEQAMQELRANRGA